MGFRIDLDFAHGPTATKVEQEPDGRLAISVERGEERAVVYLSPESVEALWYEVAVALARLRRC
ncbi:MAG: hypothetical protein HY727_05005 [Candidatus Rokubacteria bacterium]|nr:hypothetical protein [Candidatus Rokubacteria bacterium]